MTENWEKARAIERELAEHFASLCLDNRPERMAVARWIAKREEERATAVPTPRAANDPAAVLPLLTIAEAGPRPTGLRLHRIPVYDVRLVQSRHPLMLPFRMVDNSEVAARGFHTLIGMGDREAMACLFVNANHEITGAHTVAMGGQSRISDVDKRVILRASLAACAAAIVLGHNHPSNDPSPSPEDITTTERIMRAALEVGVPVIDHVIVTRERGRYHSMLDRGVLPQVY